MVTDAVTLALAKDDSGRSRGLQSSMIFDDVTNLMRSPSFTIICNRASTNIPVNRRPSRLHLETILGQKDQ